MTMFVFAHRNHIGIQIEPDTPFINDPTEPGQMGVVVALADVAMTESAKDLLRSAKREPGSFAPIMLTKHNDPIKFGPGSIGVLTKRPIVLFQPEDILIGRDCDTSVLDDITVLKGDIPQGFKDGVDELLK